MANEGIKILYCADVHGDVKALELLAASADRFRSNIIICNGDLADSVLSEEERNSIIEYEKQRALLQKGEIKKIDEQLGYKAKAVLGANNTRRGKLYKNIKDALDFVALKAKCPWYCLSGEHDTLRQEGGILSDHLLDYRVRKLFVSKTSFAGIPGSAVTRGQEPDLLPAAYDEANAIKMLMKADPDIAVLHAALFFDTNPENMAIMDYMNNEAPNLILSAHTHNYGIRQWDSPSNTVVVNPGNLGAAYGSEGNTFALISLDGRNYVENARILRQHPAGEEGCHLEVLADFSV